MGLLSISEYSLMGILKKFTKVTGSSYLGDLYLWI